MAANKESVKKFISKFGAKEGQIVGGYDVMVKDDWIKGRKELFD